MVWDRNLQEKNNSTALLMKNFCERKSILIVKPNMVRHLTLAEQELHLQLGTRAECRGAVVTQVPGQTVLSLAVRRVDQVTADPCTTSTWLLATGVIISLLLHGTASCMALN